MGEGDERELLGVLGIDVPYTKLLDLSEKDEYGLNYTLTMKRNNTVIILELSDLKFVQIFQPRYPK